MRVFKVSNSAGQSVVVEATSEQAAIAHIAAKHYTAQPISTSEVLTLVRAGTSIEQVPARMRQAKVPAVKAAA